MALDTLIKAQWGHAMDSGSVPGLTRVIRGPESDSTLRAAQPEGELPPDTNKTSMQTQGPQLEREENHLWDFLKKTGRCTA